MYDVRISDSLYKKASQAAKAQHVSLDEFVAKAVQMHLQEEEPLQLTPEQIKKIRAAQEDVKAGRVFTLDEAKADLAVHRTAWLEANKR